MSHETDATPEPGEAINAEYFEAELAKARDETLRALAEAENTRRRAARLSQEARAYAIDRFAADLLPIADTLGRALAAAPEGWRDSSDETLRNLITGLELTERALVEAFARNGLRRVGAKGEPFDPKVHQAVAQAPSPLPAGAVHEVMQPGYVLADRTVRPAMVAVSAGPGDGAGAQSVDIKI
jgi:molecular chaperone GrpE